MAYVLLNVNLGKESELLRLLRGIPEVREAYAVFGAYDMMLLVQTDTMLGLKQVVTEKIRRALSDKARQDAEHIRGCPICGAYFNKTLEFKRLTESESDHLFQFLRSYLFVQDPLRSTLTLPVVETGPSRR